MLLPWHVIEFLCFPWTTICIYQWASRCVFLLIANSCARSDVFEQIRFQSHSILKMLRTFKWSNITKYVFVQTHFSTKWNKRRRNGGCLFEPSSICEFQRRLVKKRKRNGESVGVYVWYFIERRYVIPRGQGQIT